MRTLEYYEDLLRFMNKQTGIPIENVLKMIQCQKVENISYESILEIEKIIKNMIEYANLYYPDWMESSSKKRKNMDDYIDDYIDGNVS